ncbi:hypothetical protein PUP75_02190 [Pseudomonas chlororaphis]|uniref:hypothetical protein n=1 Tax=Pseudomonas chlororaphis TaxID=587753 RepID=UPI002367E3BE|nr:hypothetical protein [Pseudomonas chlororaphis]WDH53627.1 hypothetical protein PUP75_02190 [Pseudomonas chlororaphis]
MPFLAPTNLDSLKGKNMEKIFYVMDAYIKTYAQGAYLIMIKSSSGAIYGLSCEFEAYTQDFEKVAVRKNKKFEKNDMNFDEANWIDFPQGTEITPASWDEIMSSGFSDYVIGYQLESEVGIHRFQ